MQALAQLPPLRRRLAGTARQPGCQAGTAQAAARHWPPGHAASPAWHCCQLAAAGSSAMPKLPHKLQGTLNLRPMKLVPPTQIKPAVLRNHESYSWVLSKPWSASGEGQWTDEVAQLREWVLWRLAWLDSAFPAAAANATSAAAEAPGLASATVTSAGTPDD